MGELFALNNEHRMVTSRLIYAASFWLTGTINFSAISLIGNASIIALCAMLLLAARTGARRLCLGVLLAALLFQLEHYENFLWSGSSSDHFQVVIARSRLPADDFEVGVLIKHGGQAGLAMTKERLLLSAGRPPQAEAANAN